MENNINIYLKLIAAVMANTSEANIDAVEAFEAANPDVVDATFQAAGPLSYEVVSGTVSAL